MRVIKDTTRRINDTKLRYQEREEAFDTRIDIPMRFLLWKYKHIRKQLFGLFSACYQRRSSTPEKEVARYLHDTHMDVHPAHVRMIERLVSYKAFTHIWHSYMYFDMDAYDHAQGMEEELAHLHHQEPYRQCVVRQELYLAYLQERMRQMNRNYSKEIVAGHKELLHWPSFFTQLGSAYCKDLKAYGLLPNDLQVYGRLVDGMPRVDEQYLRTYLTAFRDALTQGGRSYAAAHATHIVDTTYNLQLTPDEQQAWESYGYMLVSITDTPAYP